MLTGRFGHPYLYREQCESTQLLLGPDLPHGAAAVCDEQVVGRGRLGRAWHAPPGTAILCSLLLKPPAGRSLPELSLVGANAAADAIETALNLAVQLKWPNDVMVRRYKVAGVLGEARDETVVLGIGLNVNQAREQLPADTRVQAGSLRTIDGRERERAPLLASVLGALEQRYEQWLEGGLDAMYASIGARDFLRGRHVSVDGVSGIALGIDRAGRLGIDVGGEHRLVESGDVAYER